MRSWSCRCLWTRATRIEAGNREYPIRTPKEPVYNLLRLVRHQSIHARRSIAVAYLDSYSYASFSASISIVIDRGGVRVVPHRVTVLLASPWPTRSPPALDEARGRGGDSGGLRRTLTAPAPPGRSAPSPRPACPLVLVTLTGRQWVARTRHSHTAHAHRPLISSPSIGPPQAQPLRAAGHAIAIDCQPIPLSRQSPFGRIPLLTARVQRVSSLQMLRLMLLLGVRYPLIVCL